MTFANVGSLLGPRDEPLSHDRPLRPRRPGRASRQAGGAIGRSARRRHGRRLRNAPAIACEAPSSRPRRSARRSSRPTRPPLSQTGLASAAPIRTGRCGGRSNWAWYKKADAEGLGDLAGFLNRVVASLVTAGESFIDMTTTDRGELRLRLYNPEQIDPALNQKLPGGEIVAGIEIDAAGNRAAFHIRENPDLLLMPMALPPVRIPATEILHVFEPPYPGSVRGRKSVHACRSDDLGASPSPRRARR